jgi:hypothetical protein
MVCSEDVTQSQIFLTLKSIVISVNNKGILLFDL